MDYVTRTQLDAARIGLQLQMMSATAHLDAKVHEALLTRHDLIAGFERLGRQNDALRLELKTEVQEVRLELKAAMLAGFVEMKKGLDDLNMVASNGYGVNEKRLDECEAAIKALNDPVLNPGR